METTGTISGEIAKHGAFPSESRIMAGVLHSLRECGKKHFQREPDQQAGAGDLSFLVSSGAAHRVLTNSILRHRIQGS